MLTVKPPPFDVAVIAEAGRHTHPNTSYRPEIDTSAALAPTQAAYFQSQIGVLRWIVELGHVDICYEVSMPSSHLALPRAGHLEQVLHIFAYLQKYHNTEMAFDVTDPVIEEHDFECDNRTTSEFGLGENEPLPSNIPKPLSISMVMREYVDSDHATTRSLENLA